MATSRHKKRGFVTGSIGLGLAATVGASLIVTAHDPASADGPQLGALSQRQVMEACNVPDETEPCTWEGVTVEKTKNRLEIVGEGGVVKWINCAAPGDDAEDAIQIVNWKRESSHTWSFGVEVEGSFKVSALFESMKASVAVSEDLEFTSGRSFSSSTRLVIPPGETGWLVHSERRLKAKGTLHARLKLDKDGRVNKDANPAFLDVYKFTDISMDAPEADSGGDLAAHTRKHTAVDKAECAEAPAPGTGGTSDSSVVESRNGDDLPLT